MRAEGWRWAGHLAALLAAGTLARAAVSGFFIADDGARLPWVPVLEVALGLALVALAVHAYRRWRPLMAEEVRADWEREKEREKDGAQAGK